MIICEDCAWPYPLSAESAIGAECDNCGGKLVDDEDDS